MNMNIDVSCPQCHSNDTLKLEAHAKILHLFKSSYAPETWLKCSACGGVITQKELLDNLKDQLKEQVREWERSERTRRVVIVYYDPVAYAEAQEIDGKYVRPVWVYGSVKFTLDVKYAGSLFDQPAAGLYEFDSTDECDLFCAYAKFPKTLEADYGTVWHEWRQPYDEYTCGYDWRRESSSSFSLRKSFLKIDDDDNLEKHLGKDVMVVDRIRPERIAR
jgi:Zn ribbon nucleic-acid-binding protein